MTDQCIDCTHSIEEELDRLFCMYHLIDVTDKEDVCERFIKF